MKEHLHPAVLGEMHKWSFTFSIWKESGSGLGTKVMGNGMEHEDMERSSIPRLILALRLLET